MFIDVFAIPHFYLCLKWLNLIPNLSYTIAVPGIRPYWLSICIALQAIFTAPKQKSGLSLRRLLNFVNVISSISKRYEERIRHWTCESELELHGLWMSTVVLYCCCHSDSASVLLYFTLWESKMLKKSKKGKNKFCDNTNLNRFRL